ncbi:MAG: LD-carboxypeptidase [Agathobacter sp.]|nr:LD-carboxypeptidase [Agathobacter sp.]
MRYPEFLKENGTIGFVAPSFGCAIEPYHTAFKNALNKWSKMGYGTDLGPNCFASSGIGISNDPKLCGQELNDWYCSDKNDIIISCGGGELMCEVVPYMDFERMQQAKPKWYMGFSDNTNFTFLSATVMDTAAIYGPCAAAFGMEPWHASIQDAWDLLCGRIDTIKGYGLWERESLKDEEHPLLPYNVTEPSAIKSFVCEAGQATVAQKEETIEIEGRLIGGCMDILQMYPGTTFDKIKAFNEKYKEDGFIWFLEACDLNIMSIRRAIWQMKQAGWFEHLKGFLIGRPLCFGEEAFGIDQYRAVTDLLSEYNVPIIMDLDIGHLAPMMPLICGSTAKISIKGNDVTIQYTFK